MRIRFTAQEAEALRSVLDSFEDAEAVGPNEYVVDLYDLDPPLSLELDFGPKGLRVLAARQMAYDEEMDGWYISEAVTDENAVADALRTLL